MDPQARAFLDAVALANQPSIATLPPEEGRVVFEGLEDLFLPKTDVTLVEDRVTEKGTPFRLYHPQGRSVSRLPATLYLHGGGWVIGSVQTHDTLCRHLANAGDVAVVSVDYRRAPEHLFPIPLEDCQDVFHHMHSHAASLGLDAGRMAVAGDSAGGNLAAALAIKVRDEGGPAIRYQCLIYPVTDVGCDTTSFEAFAVDHGLTADEMRWFWQCYVGDLANGAHPLASPNRARDLSGLPPTRILTAEYDVLRDEAETYAGLLERAGVEVELERIGGLIHGFFHFAGAMDRGREVVLDTGRWLGDVLRR